MQETLLFRWSKSVICLLLLKYKVIPQKKKKSRTKPLGRRTMVWEGRHICTVTKTVAVIITAIRMRDLAG